MAGSSSGAAAIGWRGIMAAEGSGVLKGNADMTAAALGGVTVAISNENRRRQLISGVLIGGKACGKYVKAWRRRHRAAIVSHQ